jgi:pSer/pThr/pTyr-binding forkhead associated (FHA) protein
LEREAADEPTTTAAVVAPGDNWEAFELSHEAALAGVPAGGGALVVTRGPNAGSRFVLAPEEEVVTTIGRHPDSDIFLDDITVSRRHAEVRWQDGGFRAQDVGSLNGTYLNRERIDNALLASGDELQVGKFRLLFLAPGPSTGTA